MYWPIGTPRIYASSRSHPSGLRLFVSHDGLASPSASTPTSASLSPLSRPISPSGPPSRASFPPSHPSAPLSHHSDEEPSTEPTSIPSEGDALPPADPILALRVARAGHQFAVITATSITLWQTKPTVVLAVVVRSEHSLQTYGKNVDLLLRPDSAILVARTDQDYLITYSIATDNESRVYKPLFPLYHNVQRRRQNLMSMSPAQAELSPSHFLWGPGEGAGVCDVNVRFRMVIRIDAGIESALALDDELVVATRKPAAVQCIRWTPDGAGNQTRTEILGRMTWVEKKVCIAEMTHDRPMNLATWITSDGRVYAVQREQDRSDGETATAADSRRLFHGHCFHQPEGAKGRAVRAVINARFSLIAVGCSDGTLHIYTVRDYAGNIAHSHSGEIPVSMETAGALTTLTYSPDGYCLFAGFERGWSYWSMFGKLGSHSFRVHEVASGAADEPWLSGTAGAAWIGGGSELLLIGPQQASVWCLEMARSAVSGCYNEANVFRTVLQTPTAVMIYRGYGLPDLTSISAEPLLWHTAKVPAQYLMKQWPIRQVVISPDGRYVAVAGRRGLAHYSINSGRWKTFANETDENEFQVRGGMCWHRNVLVASVESNRSHELRLFSREAALDRSQALCRQPMPAPVVVVTTSGEDSLLVYTYENLLYHFVFAPWADSVRLVQVGQIAFHGIVRSPARVRGLSWILPESQMADGDPSQDVAVASVIFLVDGKLVLLSPSVEDEDQPKYEMRIIARKVEYHVSMRDQPRLHGSDQEAAGAGPDQDGGGGGGGLRDSLWLFDGTEVKAWTSMREVLEATLGDGVREMVAPVSVPVDFYPLSVVLEKGIILGVESDLVRRRDVAFSFFHLAIRTHLVLPDVLRFYLRQNKRAEAGLVAEQYQDLEYFEHGLEVLLHRVLDEEAEGSAGEARLEEAVLPRVLSLLSSSKGYLDVVLQCTRKTDVRLWKTLFAHLPPAQELFEESLRRGRLKTAGGFLIILHTLEEVDSSREQSVRVLSRAIGEGDWELCKELARFLMAMDETGQTLREAMAMASAALGREEGGGGGDGGLANGGGGGGGGGGGDDGEGGSDSEAQTSSRRG